MKITRRIAILVITALFAFSSFSPAFARQSAAVRVQIDNRTTEHVKLILQGPTNTTLNIEPGKNKADIPLGVYSYSYSACGRQLKGTFNVKKAGDVLRLPRCITGQTGNAYVVLENETSEAVTITLVGPETYRFVVSPGSIKVEIEHGKYTYSHDACGLSGSGKLRTKTELNVITFAKCKGDGGGENPNAPGETSNGKTVVLLVVNQMDASFSLTLTGPRNYTFVIPLGRTKLTVAKGDYTWHVSTSACGGYQEEQGRLNMNRSIIWTWRCE
jgi:hypothetical protein